MKTHSLDNPLTKGPTMKIIFALILSFAPLFAFAKGFAVQSQGCIGVAIEKVNNSFVIRDILKGSAADGDGTIQAGDYILAVQQEGTPDADWLPVAGMQLTDLIELIRGATGTKVGLELSHGNANYSVVLTRAEIVTDGASKP
jgi:C-terminal processing protease CtpA/Prc